MLLSPATRGGARVMPTKATPTQRNKGLALALTFATFGQEKVLLDFVVKESCGG